MVFFGIICLILMQFQSIDTMSTLDTTQEQTMTEVKLVATRAPRKALASRKKGTSRQPGRPHKRLTVDVLSARTSVLHKKLQVLMAKRTLIAERLEAYELETQMRDKEQTEKEQEDKEV